MVIVLLYRPDYFAMKVAGFDAKAFHRGKPIPTPVEDSDSVEKYLGFNSQLGVGAIIADDAGFAMAFAGKSGELRESFGIKEKLPFFSSTQLKQILGLRKAISFADKTITAVQGLIESVHCSYTILPPKTIETIPVGGFKSSLIDKPTNEFIDSLGPMFSYLTAHSYLYQNRYVVEDNMDFHIDSFRSKRTKAWDRLIGSVSPKIFWRGDECNPFIACADLLAFLTDVKLYNQRLKLEPNDIKKIWSDYSFDVTVNFYDKKSLHVYSWSDNENIDIIPYIARPTIFLAVDDVETLAYSNDSPAPTTEEEISDKPVVRKFNQVIKQSDVYHSAVRYAFQKHGSVKIFHRHEDMKAVRDGDVFVYVGSNSKMVGESFRDAYEIELLPGVELRRRTKGLLSV